MGTGSVRINLHYCSREERKELIDYLSDKSWDFVEDSEFKRREDDEKIKSG